MNIDINNKKYVFIWSFVLILFLIFIFSLKKDKKNIDEYSDLNNASTTTVDLGGGLKAVGKGDFKIEQINTKPISYENHPDLNVSINFDKNINEETQSFLKSKIDDTRVKLANDPSLLSLWAELGMYYKIAGDYTNAKIYWQYVLSLSPQDITVLSNLADLNAFYLKDVQLAISLYRKAITASPKSPELYIKLADVYITVLSDSPKAKEVLQDGLKVLPSDKALLSALEKIK